MLESLEQVATAVGTLATETRALAKEVRIENAERKRQNLFQIVLTVVVLLLLGLVVAQVFRQASDSAARAKAATEQREAQLALAQQINDCITPQGECFRRNQANQAMVLQQLIDVSVLASRCSVVAGDDVAAFDACLKAKGINVVVPQAPAR